ncbi:maleylpyruvate isomerase N-terminal domain-containing protein [Streptomyces sp. NPDC005925]|uniref:maleylpyruvate isomerase N-terminal domain-containing protein n=1 Tax=Streptomyces sp. NPDC005925 TaxID=3157172 RepID=UPI00340CB6FD
MRLLPRLRIPPPRVSVEGGGRPLPPPAEHGRPCCAAPPVLGHRTLKSLLGAWALAACPAEEAAVVEEHLRACAACAEEAEGLRDAVGLLQRPESLDLSPALRTRVLDACLERRPPRIPVPEWATAYDAETARLDALLQDFGEAEWRAPVRLRWFADDEETGRRTTVAGVIAHLLTVDGLVAAALGLDDPLGETAAEAGTPTARTEAYWRVLHMPPSPGVRAQWREQSHDLVRTAAFTGGGEGRMPISYGGTCVLPLADAMLDRAFECWLHAEDIAQAVDYPYELPSARHLNRMIDLAARQLPRVLAGRTDGPAASDGHRHLFAAGAPCRSLRLEIEGSGGGEWLIPLDSPAAVGSAEHEVAHIALDSVEFCRLAAGHVSPQEAAVGQLGDKRAIEDVLFAAASLSRM